MSLGFTPAVEIYGANAALLNERLLSWTHVDAAGIESDQLTLVISLEGLEGLPSLGGKIGLRVGYLESGLVDKGEFVITRRTPTLFPLRLTLVAMAAPFSAADQTGFKQRRSVSHGPTTLGALFRELTARHGFSPRVAPELSLIKIGHIDQSNETDMGFLTRLAHRHDAVAKPINEWYVLARRGQAKSLSGKVLPQIKLSVTTNNRPGDQAFISAVLDETARAKYQGCKTRWWDAAAGKVQVEESGIAPFKILRQHFQSAEDARAAGEGEVRRLMREALKVAIECPGNPGLSAEGIVLLDPTWPDFMRGRWSIDKVTATGDREKSYRCKIDATCLDAKA
ncbi:contractile injection system protein, VgrG/Pvc8 family [Pseudomonas corrugata]|uniref:Phage tail protein n=1 Tax=Pseudomonas corrugata TaxID=47879 RepID=A0A3M3EZ58_9PSED|nr:contractile injection system protein, VgrG/Pvc8 family [Pseudomonas corrugata]AOE64214.1 phage tail protein [Pseudomonas corrugata]MDU9022288.1 contractile injection system protein, VgrG/Pvc8 family [Pseudomonas corrugata]MDU9034879.1 contractile injection system protein, VgrG/Pvc8 family [Pseudomonas corrugata]MDU9038586.1 contractile injection system protein, VgrG/Pvc8 family [Pseudomonas corrugata]QTH15494.1 phage late control D family protein [Pseudomonas corrugata]